MEWASYAILCYKDDRGNTASADLAMHDEAPTPDDSAIVARVLQGNVNAFESLLVRHRELVQRIVSKHVPFQDAEETVQEVFIRAYRSLSSFEGRAEFSRWLSSIAVRTCYDYWRKAYRYREVPVTTLTEKHQEWLEKTTAGESIETLRESESRKEAGELLDWALSRMSAENRMVLELLYLEGLSVKETADLLGWSIANVKVRAFRSKRIMEKLLRGVAEEGRRSK
jgi:RNA polymerase sigma-70 factor (ECF subfamily)